MSFHTNAQDRSIDYTPAAIPLVPVDRCLLCGASRGPVVVSGPDQLQGVPGVFTIVRCDTCGLLYQSPRPAESSIDRLYPAAYEPFQGGFSDDGYIPRDLRRTVAFVDSIKPGGGRLLDVGCGVGDFLAALRRSAVSWKMAGVEPSPHAVAVAQQRGLPVQQGTLETAPADSFDVITLWNVLEHVPDPRATLREIDRRLAPDGVLCLAVPVCDSWEARLFRNRWVGWELPRHFFLFNHATIRRTLETAGFQIIESACISGTYYGVVRSAQLVLEHRIHSYALRRIARAALSSRLVRALVKVYEVAAESQQRGTVLTLAARRTRESGA